MKKQDQRSRNSRGNKAFDLVQVQCVHAEQPGTLHSFQTVGLESRGHKEIHLLAPGYCQVSAVSMLLDWAELIVEKGVQIVPNKSFYCYGCRCRFTEVPGEREGDPTRLRIMDEFGANNRLDVTKNSLPTKPVPGRSHSSKGKARVA